MHDVVRLSLFKEGGMLENHPQVKGSTRIGWRPRPLARALDVSPHIIYAAISADEFGEVWRFGESGKAIVIPDKAVQEWLERKRQTIGDSAA